MVFKACMGWLQLPLGPHCLPVCYFLDCHHPSLFQQAWHVPALGLRSGSSLTGKALPVDVFRWLITLSPLKLMFKYHILIVRPTWTILPKVTTPQTLAYPILLILLTISLWHITNYFITILVSCLLYHLLLCISPKLHQSKDLCFAPWCISNT